MAWRRRFVRQSSVYPRAKLCIHFVLIHGSLSPGAPGKYPPPPLFLVFSPWSSVVDASPEATADSINTTTFSHVEPHLVVRCARHYERAAAVVVSAAVRTASKFVEPPPTAWRLTKVTDDKGEVSDDTVVNPYSGGASGGTDTAVGADKSCSDGVVESSPAEEKQGKDHERHEQEQQHQQDAHQDRISRMNPRDQAIARHSQVFANHRKIVAENAKRTQERMLKDRRRFEQQQQQQQQRRALPVGACVTSKAAARIDLAGGWTDTPPISYEAGGAVVNAAVTVSGERPVEARCERIEQRTVELVCVALDGTVTSRTLCSRLEDFA